MDLSEEELLRILFGGLGIFLFMTVFERFISALFALNFTDVGPPGTWVIN